MTKSRSVLLLSIVLGALCANSYAAKVTVTVSSPTATTVTSPVRVAAKATSVRPITGWRVYVDGATAYSAGANGSISTDVQLSGGTHSMIVRAWDSSGSYGSTTFSVSVPSATPISLTTAALPGGTVGKSYSAALSAAGGTAPYSWSVVSGQLPAGLSLSPTGVISGTPTVSGQYTFTVQVKDSASTPQAATGSYSVAIANGTTATGTVLWSANQETGDFSQWSANSGGGVYNSGIATSVGSHDYVHTGSWSAKMTITTPSSPSSGVRLARWKESDDSSYFANGLYYSAWYYFPARVTVSGNYWNIFQFKSKHAAGNDPFWYLDVKNRADGSMYLTLRWWGGLTIEGPHVGEHGGRTYTQSLANLPVGKWVHIEAYLRQSSNFTGRITVWQDGVQVLDQNNVTTKYSDGDNRWYVTNYSDGLTPSTTTIYSDDATVSTYRLSQ